jgi:hypothetical protein
MKNKKGGGIFNFFKNNSNNDSYISKTLNSELDLLDSYKKYLESKYTYEKNYNKHLKNLITLDEINKMGNSLVSVFKDIVFPNDIEEYTNYNLANPLLLRSYLISNNISPSNFRKEHIRQQVWYQIDKLHSNDSRLFTHVNVKMLDNSTIMVSFTLLEIYKFDRKISISNNYILDVNEINNALVEIVGIIKADKDKHIGKNIKTIKVNNNNFLIKNENIHMKNFNNSFISNTKKLNNKLKRNNKTGKILPQKRAEIKPVPKQSLSNNNKIAQLKYESNFNKFKQNIYENRINPTGENKPLTKKQILHFQHQQVIPVEEERNNKGKPIFAVSDITNDVRELLGLEVQKPNKVSFYDDIPLEKLKNMDFSQLSKDSLDKICQRFSEDEETCKKIEQCWFNAKKNPKCYRFKGKDE